jgi:prefoldin subunit 5
LGWTVTRIYHSIDDLWRKHDEVTQRLTKLAIELPKQYVTKDDLTKAIDVIHERFDKLEVKIDQLNSK